MLSFFLRIKVLHRGLNGVVVALAAAASEDDFGRLAVDCFRDLRSRGRDGVPRGNRKGVPAAGVPEVVPQKRRTRGRYFGEYRRSGVVVEVHAGFEQRVGKGGPDCRRRRAACFRRICAPPQSRHRQGFTRSTSRRPLPWGVFVVTPEQPRHERQTAEQSPENQPRGCELQAHGSWFRSGGDRDNGDVRRLG